MGIFSDLKILYHMALHPVRGKDHAARLDSFYSGQANDYDDFRKRLLKGRETLWERLLEMRSCKGLTMIDMGGGTGSNLAYLGDSISKFQKIYLVDLAGSLLKVAAKRIEDKGWTNVETAEADATKFVPAEGTVDLVTFSYSLTMIPDWFRAIDHACTLLKPGGRIGVVDFYVSRKYPEEAHKRHNWLKRAFWPVWFNSDNVFPSPDHVPYLHNKFEAMEFQEHLTRIPWFPNPLAKMPYYIFIGEKK